jgi:hypothetical protein
MFFVLLSEDQDRFHWIVMLIHLNKYITGIFLFKKNKNKRRKYKSKHLFESQPGHKPRLKCKEQSAALNKD